MKCEQKVRAARMIADLTQAQMAEKLCIRRETYAFCENGRIRMTVDRLMEIADILGVPAEELLPDREQESKSAEENCDEPAS